ncbi:MAG TPA: cytochrome C oxidase Cbb3, partial [Polyangia bacterium]
MARALVAVLLVAGCGARSALDYGRAEFSDATVSTAASNPFKCSTCHEIGATTSKSLPGYTMFDAAVRQAWWGGTVTTLLDATNQCVTQFMRGKALTADDEKGRAIFVYLESLAPDASAPTQSLTVTQNIVDVPSGDAVRGKMWWDQGCGNCHGAPHTGAGRISDAASLVPDDSIA